MEAHPRLNMSDSSSLQEFIARHSKPYDPASDDYERPPFAADIKEGKNDPIYNAHSYHTKVPPRSIIPYILHYTQPGDLVLDPFCGSGMTGVAAQMCADPPADILDQFPELKACVGRRACILNDLSPAACHIAYNYNTPVNVEALRSEFERVKAGVHDEFDRLYGTEHYEPAIGAYATDALARHVELFSGVDATHRKMTLLSRGEVEERLGYPVNNLPRDSSWGDVDLAKIERWVCIPAVIQYTIWSDVYKCEGFVTIEEPTGKVSTRGKNAGKSIMRKKSVSRGCGANIVIWDAMANEKDEGSEFNCPTCRQRWEKVDLPFLSIAPVVADFTFKNSRGKRDRRSRTVTARELLTIEQATPEGLGLWYPQHKIYAYRELMTMSANKRGVTKTSDFYTKRNLAGLALIWNKIQEITDSRTRAFARFAFTGIIPYCCRKQNYGGGGGGMSGTLYLPSFHQEKNVLAVFERKVAKLAEEFCSYASLEGSVYTQLGSAADLSDIIDSSVDYIFTDPPFGGNIFYADASILWESWLDSFTDVRQEMVYHRRSRQQRVADGYIFKTIEDYEADMRSACCEFFRVLKPGRWCTLEFNNSDGQVFDAIKRAVSNAGFKIANMLLLDKGQKSFKQVKGLKGEEDVVDKDVLFNLYKPAVVNVAESTEDHDLEQQITDVAGEHLRTLPERIKAEPARYSEEHRTTATINSILMNALIPRGVSVERLNLPVIERVCRRYFRKVGQHWYLRGEAVGSARGGGLFEEELEIRSELSAIDWLRQKIQSGPKLIGELKPLWMRAIGLLASEISQALILEDLLSENFWRDADTNRWREPSSDEREKMSDDRSLRVLHDAERFVNGTLRRSTTDAERADWIDVVFHACRAVEDEEEDALSALRGFDAGEAYVLITRLFQGILRDHITDEAWRKVEKQASAASRRIAFRANEQKLKAIKARGSEGEQEHFDFGKG
jgi:DNA modification methylase